MKYRLGREVVSERVDIVECRQPSVHGNDTHDAAVTLGSSQGHSRSFYVFDKHVKISEVILHQLCV